LYAALALVRVWGVSDPEHALGPQPRDPAQRADWQRVRAAVERVHHKQRIAERTRQHQPTREPAPTSGGPVRWPRRSTGALTPARGVDT
jgi:hypothetical protein